MVCIDKLVDDMGILKMHTLDTFVSMYLCMVNNREELRKGFKGIGGRKR